MIGWTVVRKWFRVRFGLQLTIGTLDTEYLSSGQIETGLLIASILACEKFFESRYLKENSLPYQLSEKVCPCPVQVK